MPEPLFLSVDKTAEMLGLGLSTTKKLIASGQIHSCQVYRRRMIPAGAVREFVARLELPEEERIAAAVARVVANAPELTADQVAMLRAAGLRPLPSEGSGVDEAEEAA